MQEVLFMKYFLNLSWKYINHLFEWQKVTIIDLQENNITLEEKWNYKYLEILEVDTIRDKRKK